MIKTKNCLHHHRQDISHTWTHSTNGASGIALFLFLYTLDITGDRWWSNVLWTPGSMAHGCSSILPSANSNRTVRIWPRKNRGKLGRKYGSEKILWRAGCAPSCVHNLVEWLWEITVSIIQTFHMNDVSMMDGKKHSAMQMRGCNTVSLFDPMYGVLISLNPRAIYIVYKER